MAKLCPECHHRPSMRDGDPAYCYCACHDVADAAPDLLAALDALCNSPNAKDNQMWDEARAALHKAQGHAPEPRRKGGSHATH